MANAYACIEEVQKAAGRQLPDDQLEKIFDRAQNRIANYVRQGMDPREAAQRAGREFGEDIRLKAAITARENKINLLRRGALDDRVVPGREADSVQAALTGTERKGNFRNAALSVDAVGQARAEQALGPLTRSLVRGGLMKVLMLFDKGFDRDLGNEMALLSDPTWGKASGNKFAARAAKLIHARLDATRVMQNEAGAWISKLDQYITRQSHDAEKIRAMGYDKWHDLISPKLDTERTFRDVAFDKREGWLRDVYNALSTGKHEGATGSDWLGGFRGPQNAAKRASQERKLFFKSADDWMDYNNVAGKGSVTSAAFHQIEHGARNAGVMSVLGTNPQAMLENWIDRLGTRLSKAGDQASHEQVSRLEREAGKNSRILEYAMRQGSGSDVPAFSKFMATWRAVNDMHMTGFLSYLSDIGTEGAVVRHAGGSVLDGYVNGIASLLPQADGRLDAAARLGQGFEGFLADVHVRSRALDNTLPSRVKSLANAYEKWNGVKWWVRSQKVGTAHMISSEWAARAGTEFDSLPKLMQTTLRRYGIEGAEWDLIRGQVEKMPDGNRYLFPDALHNIPDTDLAGIAKGTTQLHLDTARQGLIDKLSTAYTDQVRTALSEPTAGISLASNFGRGRSVNASAGSEIMRSLMQFKTFPMVHVMRSVTREIMRDGLDLGGLTGLLGSTGLLGYAAYNLKKMTRGQEPAIPGVTQKPSAGNVLKDVMAGLAQGGGLGLYGDLLFGDTTHYGGSLSDTLGGPSYGQINDLYTAFAADKGTALEGTTTGKKLATQAVRLIRSNTPMANLWWAKGAIDYLLTYSAMERANPGYLRRYQQQIAKDQGVHFMPGLDPTTAHARTFGR